MPALDKVSFRLGALIIDRELINGYSRDYLDRYYSGWIGVMGLAAIRLKGHQYSSVCPDLKRKLTSGGFTRISAELEKLCQP